MNLEEFYKRSEFWAGEFLRICKRRDPLFLSYRNPADVCCEVLKKQVDEIFSSTELAELLKKKATEQQ